MSRKVEVRVNVYDIVDNKYVYWIGFGVFHSGVEVYGREYAYGSSDRETSGIFSVEPYSAYDLPLRESVVVGETSLSQNEVVSLLRNMGDNEGWTGASYDMLKKNCNSFSDEVAFRLTGNHAPTYINRLAKFGSSVQCLLPQKWTSRQPEESATTSRSMQGNPRRLTD